MTEKTTMHQFLPGAQSWGSTAELGSASNALAIFSHSHPGSLAGQGKRAGLSPGQPEPERRRGLQPALCCPSKAPRTVSKSHVCGQAEILFVLMAEGSLGATSVGQKFQNLRD